jgi:hypothetical protein
VISGPDRYPGSPPGSLRWEFLIKDCARQIQVKSFGRLSVAARQCMQAIAEGAHRGAQAHRGAAQVRAPPAHSAIILRKPGQGRPIRESRAAHAARVARSGPPPTHYPRLRQSPRTGPCGPTNG